MSPIDPPQIYSVVPIILPPDQLFGPLFHDVQMNHVFPDSITFADCFPKRSPEEILSLYEIEKHKKDFDLKDFVSEYFEIPSPIKTEYESNQQLPVTEHISKLWPLLTRTSQTNCSMLPVPKSYVVPGGRFRGLYYWDSYFTMLGLQSAGEHELIRDMVDNFAHLIDTYGHIPNANRSYYLTRSQPPFFALMIRLLADIDGTDVYAKYLPHMQKEYNYWMDGYFRLSDKETSFRRVLLMPDGSILNRYWDDLPAPRPESYVEDVEMAHKSAAFGVEPGKLYRHIRAACESGWDFTCRWFREPSKMETIHTTDIIPVDLNCLLYDLEMTLSEAYKHSSFTEPSTYFHQKAEKRKKAMMDNLWNEDHKFFMDYDSESNKSTKILSLAGVYPLFFKMATKAQAEEVHKHITEGFLHKGGVVSSLPESGQQWDFPNGWAPMQYITYVALRNYGYDDTAKELKNRWITLNDDVFKETGKMMEKYNVVNPDSPAGGGEYPNQDGFGWTNAIYLWLKNNE
ncbi:alpha,alpha-trehalase TreF [Anditalea andensis]|uniref:Trehalase n=1 Tax=Anditalea andensis TaxID=1048983 RepID=A0A074L6Z8_9BACT|nr:alpha,alpha-trehalase TreF [Anditalea andensis]KEO75588.1 trehalase [Anditalea andensis]